ncbi:AAA family ATPase [Sorangium sp. So ce185]|uniref:ATP-binding protein n=1 Tax=Sorangium sp. So ce185 TaxID=3133287 RepID=UPI003F60DA35
MMGSDDDRGHGLPIPQKLYGRDAEIAALLAAWERASRGAAELALISGHAGIGKSAVVSELHRAIAGHGARFISGKFDQFNRSVPYASLAQALRELARHLLTERGEALSRLRRKLATALGQSGQVLVDLLPELELIIGPQPPVPELGAAESQNRLDLVFQSFLRVFATAEHPLVLFLDDLQWADLASLRLLTLLLSDPERGHLLVIGAYRDDEVDAGHPLSAARAELRKAGASMVEITLDPLRPADLNQLLADALGCGPERSAALATLVLDKTQGNPFFINQFLVSLYKDRLIAFDPQSGAFSWDLDRIRRAGITDNVVDFMAKKLRRLSPSAQRVLTLAACIGHKFDLETLALVDERPPEATAADLREALREGVVLPLDAEHRYVRAAPDHGGEGGLPAGDIDVSYRFLHDRVRQAAYSLVDEDRKQDLHLRIGRLMLARRELGERDEHLFDTVNHLNLGASRIASPDERTILARLNLAAGMKAKASAAYDVAAGYFGAGVSLVDDEGWEQDYELAFALHLEGADCGFLSGRSAEAEPLFNVSLTRARTDLDRAHVYARRILLFNTVARFDESVRCARTALALLGIELPEREDRIRAALAAELAEVPRNLASRQITELCDAPELKSPEHKAALTILTNVSAAILVAEPSLHALVCVKHANISLKHGHAEVSAWGYLIYAIVLIEQGRYAEAYEFGRLAMDLDEKMGCAVMSSKVKSSFAVFISPYREPLRRSFAYLAQAHRDGRETGDFQFASYSLLHGVTSRLSHGVALGAVSEEIERSLPFLQRTRDVMSGLIVTSSKQMIANLRGCTLGHHTLSDGVFDEDEFSATLGAPNHEFMAAFYHIQRAQLAYLYGDHERALALIALAEPLRPYLANMWMSTEVPFYASLILLALCPKAPGAEQARYAREIARHAADVAAWAESCPENFRHKHLLVSAERARVSGDDAAATDLYEEAIRAAQESEFLHHEALSNELAARFHLAKGRTKIARMYMADAVHGYARWGAEAKVAQLHETYAELTPRGPAAETARPPRRTMNPEPGATSIEDGPLYGALEEKVRERTAALEEAQAKVIRLEREVADKRMAGGFAREIEDALAGAKLALARALGQDESSSRPCLTFDSGVELGKLHEELSLRFSDEEMERMSGRLQHIFENQEELDAALRLAFKATDHALAVAREIIRLSAEAHGG